MQHWRRVNQELDLVIVWANCSTVYIIIHSYAALAEGESGRDNIGDTVISKAWALSVMVRAVESVSRQASRDSSHSCSKERTSCMCYGQHVCTSCMCYG